MTRHPEPLDYLIAAGIVCGVLLLGVVLGVAFTLDMAVKASEVVP